MMKTVRDVMTAGVVSASPSARVRTAVILIKGHNVGVLPIVESNDLVIGVVTRHHLLGEPDDIAVSELMSTDFTSVDPNATVAEAAEIMRKAGTSFLLVMENSKLVGIVCYGDLVPELGKTYDPLTGLPWSDTFREWAVAALKRGVEITIIFFDLDRFGTLNKLYGHVVGDKALIDVAGAIRQSVDYEQDCACRYGGDEFAIVTTRSFEDAERMALSIQQGIAEISIAEVPDGVRGTFGISGGRRTEERQDIHYAATIDNLITKASKDCISRKPADSVDSVSSVGQQQAPQEAVEIEEIVADDSAQAPPQPLAAVQPADARARRPVSGRLSIDSVTVTTAGASVKASVRVSAGEAAFDGEASAFNSHADGIARVAAEACANALSSYVPAGHAIQLEDFAVTAIRGGEEMTTCVLAYVAPSSVERNAGSAIVRMGDKNRAAAACVLAAINRRLTMFGVLPGAESDSEDQAAP